jgi:hypothetical protein
MFFTFSFIRSMFLLEICLSKEPGSCPGVPTRELVESVGFGTLALNRMLSRDLNRTDAVSMEAERNNKRGTWGFPPGVGFRMKPKGREP